MNCASFKSLLLTGHEHGATVLVKKKNGQLIYGELIAVKRNSLLLLDAEYVDKNIDFNEIRAVYESQNSNGSSSRKTMLVAGLIGAGLGAVIGIIIAVYIHKSIYDPGEPIPSRDIVTGGVGGAAVGGLLGCLVGFLVSGHKELYNSARFKEKSTAEVRRELVKLRSKARVPNFY